MQRFRLVSDFKPTGDQPRAIEELVTGLESGDPHQVLLGVTGSGKTFTMANVIERVQRPTLVLAHNKTLAAQLYQEFKEFFPDNAVEYFVSYYDYYQPEAYIPSTDTFIEKDSQINDAIDRMRLSATRSLLERNDVLIVASVSCIYGLGSAEAYHGMLAQIEAGQVLDRDRLLRKLVEIQYERKDFDFHRGTFRVRGDTVEIWPAYEEDLAIRVEFFGDEVERLETLDPLTGRRIQAMEKVAVYPATHYVLPPERKKAAVDGIKLELRERLAELRGEMRLVEAQRLDQRTTFDLEMMATLGFCKGIENYSRHLTGRAPGEAPPCLLDYFPKDRWLLFVDESHATIPQVGAMYRGDRSRKENLVNFGFRLPSALDNRPLRFEEFDGLIHQAVHVSATPGDWELDRTGGVVVEQIIRPTGLLDPVVEVRPARDQVDDLLAQIRHHVDVLGERVLVTTLTKRMSEDLTEYLSELRVRVRYLHSDVETLERAELIRGLRLGDFDVLIGINLLREGLDIPEVSLVAILDADKEGFLRAQRSLIQTSGRAARNVNGRVIMYADRVTKSMQVCIDETLRRRRIQKAWNEAHGVTPTSVRKAVRRLDPPPAEEGEGDADRRTQGARRSAAGSGEGRGAQGEADALAAIPESELEGAIASRREAMRKAARELEFEEAARLRDEVRALEARQLGLKASALR